jgi:altronate hydrolase
MKQKLVKVHPADNVLVALTDLLKGEAVQYNGEEFVLQDNIPSKHKFVTADLSAGDTVIMYGVMVGKAQTAIPKGGRTFCLSQNGFQMGGAGRLKIQEQDIQWLPP